MADYKKTQTFFLGVQHVLAMYAGAVIVPLIVGSSLHLTVPQIGYLIGADLLTSGIATLLQVWRNGFSGIGLPVVLGCTFTAVFPMIGIGTNFGLSAIYGAIIVSGLFVVIISRWFGMLRRFFPPVVTGSIVSIIGLTLVPVAMNNLAGGLGSPSFGSVPNLALGFVVLVFILKVVKLHNNTINLIGDVSLGIFLSMALMTLKLWELIGLAVPMIIILLAQVLFIVLYIIFIVFRLLGKSYDAAIICCGMAGHGLGATPNAIANMTAVTEKFGPSTKAFLVVPLCGAFLIDLFGIPCIVWFINYFSH